MMATIQQSHVTVISLIIVGLWTVTAVVRIWVEWPAATVIDNLMPLVGAFWFAVTAANGKKKNGAAA